MKNVAEKMSQKNLIEKFRRKNSGTDNHNILLCELEFVSVEPFLVIISSLMICAACRLWPKTGYPVLYDAPYWQCRAFRPTTLKPNNIKEGNEEGSGTR
ncbi:hypothetical protein [Entomobacter blattae]